MKRRTSQRAGERIKMEDKNEGRKREKEERSVCLTCCPAALLGSWV